MKAKCLNNFLRLSLIAAIGAWIGQSVPARPVMRVGSVSGPEVSAVLMDPNGTVIDTISEANIDAVAAFKITRPTDAVAAPLTVNFSLTGTAIRGDVATGDYFIRTNGVVIPFATSVTIAAGSDSVLVEIVANDDNISELAETIVFQLASGPSYIPVDPTGGIITITDNDPNTVDISEVVFDQMYEGNTNDLIRLTLQRRGDVSAASFEVNLDYAGTAIAGEDYTSIPKITFNPGDVTATVDIHPINDSIPEERETIVVSVGSGTGYLVGTNNVLTAGATGVIVDDDVPEGTLLFSDDFETDTSGNWTALFGSLNPDSGDYSTTFNFDYNQAGFDVPPAPHSTNGATAGLLVSVNKLDDLAEAAGVNLYPIGKDFSGNYALRFDMYLMQNTSADTTEHAMFGLNHDTMHTNWFINSNPGMPEGWEFDGLWAAVSADASGGDYLLFSAPRAGAIPGPATLAQRNASTLAQVFHQPPWSASGGAGSPANLPTTPTPSWAQVELRQVDGVVTLSVNNTNIFSYTNATGFTHGNIMLGYDDSFNPIGAGGGGLVIYDNVRVVSLGGGVTLAEVRILTISRAGDTVTIDFTAGAGELTSAFKLVSAASVTGSYTDDNTATIASLGGSNYRVAASASDVMRFYQIRRAP